VRRDDQTRYQVILDSTRGSDGIVNRFQAVKVFKELLLDEDDRIDELAEAKAHEVARAFDKAHQPEIENGQMTLFEDSYLVLGDNERVRAVDATATHTKRWLDVQAANHARVSAAWAAKDMAGRRLLDVQEKHGCSMFEAQRKIAAGEA
jgi:hypothetical protein